MVDDCYVFHCVSPLCIVIFVLCGFGLEQSVWVAMYCATATQKTESIVFRFNVNCNLQQTKKITLDCPKAIKSVYKTRSKGNKKPLQRTFDIGLCKRIFSWPFSFVATIVLQFTFVIKHFGGSAANFLNFFVILAKLLNKKGTKLGAFDFLFFTLCLQNQER